MSKLTAPELKQALHAGPHAWPGGYPLYFLAADGSALSFEAVRGEIRQVMCAIPAQTGTGKSSQSM